jgi:hypothetical protein
MDVPYLGGSPRMPKEGKQLCAKKARTNVEGEGTLAWGIKVLQWNSPRSTTGSGHQSHLPRYGGPQKCAPSASEGISESKPTVGVLCEKRGILRC